MFALAHMTETKVMNSTILDLIGTALGHDMRNNATVVLHAHEIVSARELLAEAAEHSANIYDTTGGSDKARTLRTLAEFIRS